jgi:tetratricopeptide (TPR) repeat protein
MRGLARMEGPQKDFSGSAKDFEKIKDEDIDGHQKSIKYNNLGLCYYNKGRLFAKKAKECFTTAIECYSKLGYAYYNLAVLYNRQNKEDKAKKALNECLAADKTLIKRKKQRRNLKALSGLLIGIDGGLVVEYTEKSLE